mgnify:CR=1 FL=1
MPDYDYRSCKNCVYYLPTPEGGACNAFHLISGDDEDVSHSNQCLDFETDKSYSDFISCVSLSVEDLECLDDIQVNTYNSNNANAVFNIEEYSPAKLLVVIDNPDLIIRANKRCPIRYRDWGGEEQLLQLEEIYYSTRYFSNQRRLRLNLESRGNVWKIISMQESLRESPPFARTLSSNGNAFVTALQF